MYCVNYIIEKRILNPKTILNSKEKKMLESGKKYYMNSTSSVNVKNKSNIAAQFSVKAADFRIPFATDCS